MAQYNPIFFVTSAAVSGTKLVLTLSGTPSISVRSQFVLRFAPNVAVPTGVSTTTSVWIAVGTNQYQVLDKFSMPATYDEIPLTSNGGYYNPRFSIIGGVGSVTTTTTSTTETSTPSTTTTYRYTAFNLPVLCYIVPLL